MLILIRKGSILNSSGYWSDINEAYGFSWKDDHEISFYFFCLYSRGRSRKVVCSYYLNFLWLKNYRDWRELSSALRDRTLRSHGLFLLHKEKESGNKKAKGFFFYIERNLISTKKLSLKNIFSIFENYRSSWSPERTLAEKSSGRNLWIMSLPSISASIWKNFQREVLVFEILVDSYKNFWLEFLSALLY